LSDSEKQLLEEVFRMGRLNYPRGAEIVMQEKSSQTSICFLTDGARASG
jgi:hypothetical protein